MHAPPDTRPALAAEFMARPLGTHSAALHDLLTVMRRPGFGPHYVLIETRPGAEWRLAAMPEGAGAPPTPLDARFASIEDAERHVFALRWKALTGEMPEVPAPAPVGPKAGEAGPGSLLAYADRASVAPGGRIAIKVSSPGPYRAAIRRILSPDTGPGGPPFRTAPVPGLDETRHAGRAQAIRRGSWGWIDLGTPPAAPLTLQACLLPTRLATGRQAILGTWDEPRRAGFGLMIGADGALEARAGDGTSVAVASTGVQLAEGRWQLVSARLGDGRLAVGQEPIGDTGFDPVPSAEAAVAVSFDPASAAVLRLAAWAEGEGVGGHLNGRLARPRLAGRALDRDAVRALAAHAPPHGPALIGAWDLAGDIPTDGFPDRAPGDRPGRLVNLPTRGVPGPGWSGRAWAWTEAPDAYDAVHFHDDDLADAAWETDFAVDLPADAPSGIYAARLAPEDGSPGLDVPFVVRPAPRRRAKVAFLASTLTYAAYANARGRFGAWTELAQQRLTVIDRTDQLILAHPLGLSTYDRHGDGSGVVHATRLQPVINCRPTGRLWNFAADLLIVDWLERTGQAADVIADEDLHREGRELLDSYRVLVTGSHPEYVTTAMLDALHGWACDGGRLMSMGGNGFYWRTAVSDVFPGAIEVRRAEGGVRTWASAPGEYAHAFTGERGGLWRNLGRAPNALTGSGFVANGFDASAPYRRTAASRDPRAAFVFAGIDDEVIGDAGLLMGGAAGYEIDAADPTLGTPAHALVLARSEGHSNNYGLAAEEIGITQCVGDGTRDPRIRADMVLFETPGGGAVFSTGSIAFCGSLSAGGFAGPVARLAGNVLARFLDPAPFPFPPPR